MFSSSGGDGSALLQQVDLWDAPLHLAAWGDTTSAPLGLQGSHATAIDAANTFTLKTPQQVSFGLNVSVVLHFDPTLSAPLTPSLSFAAVGADMNRM